MDKLTRIKKYKADTPERTITKIRNILCDNLGLVLEEEDFGVREIFIQQE